MDIVCIIQLLEVIGVTAIIIICLICGFGIFLIILSIVLEQYLDVIVRYKHMLNKNNKK